MKVGNLLVAAIFALSLCVVPLCNDVYAKSGTTDTETKSTESAQTAKSTKDDNTQSTAKTDKKAAKKDIPKNIDINNADKETLALLPGIGPSKADAILKYRKDNGKFKSIGDLTMVKGIGDKTLLKLKPYLKTI